MKYREYIIAKTRKHIFSKPTYIVIHPLAGYSIGSFNTKQEAVKYINDIYSGKWAKYG